MGEVRFYHLTERPLEQVLPVMLERSLERGWRVLVRGTDAARIEALSAHLWTRGDASFLPHGTEADGDATKLRFSESAFGRIPDPSMAEKEKGWRFLFDTMRAHVEGTKPPVWDTAGSSC